MVILPLPPPPMFANSPSLSRMPPFDWLYLRDGETYEHETNVEQHSSVYTSLI